MGTEDGIRMNNADMRLPKKDYVEIPCYKCGTSFRYSGDACWQITCLNCHQRLDAPKLRRMGIDV